MRANNSIDKGFIMTLNYHWLGTMMWYGLIPSAFLTPWAGRDENCGIVTWNARSLDHSDERIRRNKVDHALDLLIGSSTE